MLFKRLFLNHSVAIVLFTHGYAVFLIIKHFITFLDIYINVIARLHCICKIRVLLGVKYFILYFFRLTRA